jgi:hypothetical protein
MKKQIEPIYIQTHKRLLKVNRSLRWIAIGDVLLQFAVIAVSLLLGFLLIEIVLELPVWLRILFWLVLAAILGTITYRNILPNLRKALSPSPDDLYRLSKIVGLKMPEVKDDLVNFLQIYENKGVAAADPIKYLSLKQLATSFIDKNFEQVLSYSPLKKNLRNLTLAVCGFLVIFLLFPSSTRLSLQKIAHPTRSFQQPLPVKLISVSRDQTVLKNDPLTLRGEFDGVVPSKLWVVLESQPEDAAEPVIERLDITHISGNRFHHEIKHVKQPFSYWFEASLDMRGFTDRIAKSEVHAVKVVERPYIREIQVRLNYPSYTRMGVKDLAVNEGEITALKGTRVELRILANKMMQSAEVVFSDSTGIPAKVLGNRATAEFVVQKDGEYAIAIIDKDSIGNYQPVRYAIIALQDEMPFVEIVRPGEDLELGDELEIPMLINLKDDYGFNSLKLKGLHMKAGSTGDSVAFEMNVPFQGIGNGKAIADFAWDLSGFYLAPEDYIEYYAEVTDNDRVTGPKTSRTQTYILRLPSLTEILERSDEQLSEQLEETEDIVAESKKLKEELKEIQRELKKENELSWERKQQLQDKVQMQKEQLEKMEALQQKLEETINQLEEQDVLSPETLEKYAELQKMMEELATPEMLEALQKMQEALEKADMEALKDAMEKFEFSVEKFAEQIERTYELFKRVQLEQRMDELNKMAENLLENQKQINEQLKDKELSPETKNQLARQEENLAKESEQMKKALEQAAKEFREMMPEISEQLEKNREFMEQNQLSEQMQNMQQQIASQQQQEAQKSGEEIQRKLEQLQSSMQQSRQQMQQQQKQELMQAMQKVQQDLLQASFRQEQLMEKSRQASMASQQLNQLAKEQAQMRENAAAIVKQLLQIANKSFFIRPEMNQIMRSLMENTESAIQNLANRNPRAAAGAQQKALGNYNQAVLSMQSSMNSMMQAQSGTGFEQFMQQLQQMAGQQGQVNQETMGLFQQGQRPGGKIPGEQLAKMAAQQRAIQKSLEKLTGEMGNRKDVLGRLDELSEEMEKVIQDLQKQQVNPKVIERQQRILSRMLEAQKSVREKERSQKREAERENGLVLKSPPQLKKEILQKENRLRKDLQDALNEGYSSEYKAFIKMYYDILSRETEKK